MSAVDWMPGITHDPGAHAGYVLGACKMLNVKLHFTVGRFPGDYSIGKQGYFQFYIPRDNDPVQFAEANSICWDSGSWNGDGPGIEWERLSYDEPLTARQIINGGTIIRWLASTYGIPLTHYDGPRVPAYNGFINHGSLLGRGETQDHTDGVTAEEWALMVAPPTPTKGSPPMKMVRYNNTWLQFGVDTSGQLIQSTYDANLVLVPGAQDVVVLGGNRPSSDVTVDVLADARILVGSEDVNGKNRAVSYRPGLGWYDATGAKLP